jgi:hypothetical protein
MLSPHEFATLMLVRNAPDQINLAHADLDTLLTYRLVALDQDPPGSARPYVTHQGEAVLYAMTRGR